MAPPAAPEKRLRRVHRLVGQSGIGGASRALNAPRSTVSSVYRAALERLGLPDVRGGSRVVKRAGHRQSEKLDPKRPAAQPLPPEPATAEERREILSLRAELVGLRAQLKEADQARIDADRFRRARPGRSTCRPATGFPKPRTSNSRRMRWRLCCRPCGPCWRR